MLIPLSDLISKYNPNITGILHVGAHLAEESSDYQAAGVDEVVWVEANEVLYQQLKESVPDTNKVVNAVVGDVDNREVFFNFATNSQSSSILELGTHKIAHPEVEYIRKKPVVLTRLDTIYDQHKLSGLNFMNLDIQGAELLALIGLGDHLQEFDYIYTEVNQEKLYVDCCLVGDLDEYLSDFDRVETEWTSFGWGDAFYVRKGL